MWSEIEKSYKSNNNVKLIKALLKLPLFPIKDGYMPFLKLDKTAIERNPNTVNRICGRIKELGLDKLYEKCTQPKETNRQMGPLFRRWLQSGALGVTPIETDLFLKTKSNTVLDGSDKALKEFAEEHLGYTRDKGLDFIARFNGKYVIGEAKFISDEGEELNAADYEIPEFNPDVKKILLLDVANVDYKKTYEKLSPVFKGYEIISTLLLRDYLYCL